MRAGVRGVRRGRRKLGPSPALASPMQPSLRRLRKLVCAHPLPGSRGEGTPRHALVGVSRFALAAIFAGAGAAHAQAPAPTVALSDPVKAMVGAWEISNAARDKRCAVELQGRSGVRGLQARIRAALHGFPFPEGCRHLDHDAEGGGATPRQQGHGDPRFQRGRERHVRGRAQRARGSFSMRTQAAIRAATVSPEQLFGATGRLLAGGREAAAASSRCPANSLGRRQLQDRRQGRLRRLDPGALRLRRGVSKTTESLFAGRTGTWRFSESTASA